MKRIVVIGLRIFCLILSATVVWSCTGCGFVIINDMAETSEITDSGTAETEIPSDTDNYETDRPDNENHNTKEKDSETEGELSNDILARKYLLSVQRKKFNNITFIITTTDIETIAPQTITSDVSEARIERNQQIEKRYEVELVTRSSDINTIYESARNAVLSDTYYTDLLAIPQYNLGAFYASGLLMNIKNLPYISLTAPYFNQSSVDAASGGFGVYGVSGEAVFNPNRMAGIYMNKDLIRKVGTELPYQSVYDGTWTWEKFYNISSQVTSSLNSDTEKIYSTTSMLNDETTSNLIFSSSAVKYMSSKSMSIPSVGFSAESVSKQVDTIKQYLNDENRYSGDEQSSVAQFNDGNSVFMIARMYVMSWMPNSKTDWGVVPLPKISEKQEGYSTLADSNALMFCVPSNSNNVEAASVILQAMNAASYKQITDKFITYHMNSVVRDNDTVNMLELIMDTQVFDFALIFGSAYSPVKDGTVSAVYRAANGESVSDIYNEYYSIITEAMKREFPMSN